MNREARAPSLARTIAPTTEDQIAATVLLVDDESIIRQVGSRILMHLGHQVLEAADGEAAIRVFEEAAGGVDVVMLDLCMPRMDGPTCFEKLRVLDPQVPVLFASGDIYDRRLKRYLTLDGVRSLKKPFGTADIMEGILWGLSIRGEQS